MKKTFPTLSVAEVYSGFVLQQPSGIHELMDHLYPGIMTIGTAAMQPVASKYLLEQLPQLADIDPPVDGDDWKEYAKRVVKTLGDTLDVPGPHDVDDAVIGKAFEHFAGRSRKKK